MPGTGTAPGCATSAPSAIRAAPARPRWSSAASTGRRSSVEVAIATCRQFLAALDLASPQALAALADAPAPVAAQRVIEVTHAVTVDGGPFRFTEDFQGLEVIAQQGTVIAHDGIQPVRTPYDECVLIMPSRRLGPGLTAVRLGRFVD